MPFDPGPEQCAYAEWTDHMRRGEYDQAWRISDEMLRSRPMHVDHLPRHEQPVWDGTPLHGKSVLVRCYHGLGDTIQFVRYMPQVREIASKTTLWAQPQLVPLLRAVPGIDRMIPLHDGSPDIDHAVDVEIMELAHVFRTTLETIPAKLPYIHAQPADIPSSRVLNVGLVWEAGSWDDERSISFDLIKELRMVAGVDLHILQHDPYASGWDGMTGKVQDCSDPVKTASVMKAMDLVISVDTMTAHLAGALNVPTFTLLKHSADWRWLTERDDSPWYPSMRLFRQRSKGDWQPVIQDVRHELAKLAEQASSGRSKHGSKYLVKRFNPQGAFPAAQ
jgi:hypothetical protein